MPPTSTRTYTTYFNPLDVDRLVGGAYQELESEWLQRREHVTDPMVRAAIEARLDLLRRTWAVMLERVPE